MHARTHARTHAHTHTHCTIITYWASGGDGTLCSGPGVCITRQTWTHNSLHVLVLGYMEPHLQFHTHTHTRQGIQFVPYLITVCCSGHRLAEREKRNRDHTQPVENSPLLGHVLHTPVHRYCSTHTTYTHIRTVQYLLYIQCNNAPLYTYTVTHTVAKSHAAAMSSSRV